MLCEWKSVWCKLSSFYLLLLNHDSKRIEGMNWIHSLLLLLLYLNVLWDDYNFFPHMIDSDSMERLMSLHIKPGCSDAWPLFVLNLYDENFLAWSMIANYCVILLIEICGMITISFPIWSTLILWKDSCHCTLSQDAVMHDRFSPVIPTEIPFSGSEGHKHWRKDSVIPWCVIVANSHITKCLITNIFVVRDPTSSSASRRW